MKATIKFINPNFCGQNSIETFESIAELRKYFNEAIYYGQSVTLNVPSLSNFDKFPEENDIRGLLTEVNYFEDEFLEVYISY